MLAVLRSEERRVGKEVTGVQTCALPILKLAAAGAKLIITARSQDKLDSLENEILNNGGQCLAIAADALIEQEAAAVVRAGVERFGRLDIALLNVGGAPALDMRSMTATDVNHYMRTNYDVTVNYLFPVLEQMKQQNAGLEAHTKIGRAHV